VLLDDEIAVDIHTGLRVKALLNPRKDDMIRESPSVELKWSLPFGSLLGSVSVRTHGYEPGGREFKSLRARQKTSGYD
jgi:hypothetical protein